MTTVLVTGGAGFIGSNFIRLALEARPDWRVVVLDALTYAGNLENLEGLESQFPGRYRFVRGDVTDAGAVGALFEQEPFDRVVHFAAESHVDRSILGPTAFVQTNVMGTATLLEAARTAWTARPGRFLQVSTDEVYGSLEDTGSFTETTPLDPSSPYSASKAAADQIALSLPPDLRAGRGADPLLQQLRPLPVPGKAHPAHDHAGPWRENPCPSTATGQNVRDWIHVDDHNRGVLLVLEKGRAGQVYNLGARCEMRNLDLVKALLRAAAAIKGWDPAEVEGRIRFVTDRPGHDWRYAIDPSKSEHELGFAPRVTFEEGLASTVRWYLEHEGWWRRVQSGEYQDFVKRLYGERP